MGEIKVSESNVEQDAINIEGQDGISKKIIYVRVILNPLFLQMLQEKMHLKNLRQ